MLLGSRTATLPMVLMFLPHPWGKEDQVWLYEGGTQKQSLCDGKRVRLKKRDICFSSLWETSPWSWRLGWSPPDRAQWLLQGSQFVSRLPQAYLALIQSNPFHLEVLYPQQVMNKNNESDYRCNCVFTFTNSTICLVLWGKSNIFFIVQEAELAWLCLVVSQPHHLALIPLVTMMPGGTALFIFTWLALLIFTHSRLGVWGDFSGLRSFNTTTFYCGSVLIMTPSNPPNYSFRTADTQDLRSEPFFLQILVLFKFSVIFLSGSSGR